MAKIITVGLSPCWDIICEGRNLNWQSHQVVDHQTSRPAGKALNISRALAWMQTTNIAAGLWGKEDYAEMVRALKPLQPYLKVRMTPVAGKTRRNVTVIDTSKKREMHLRSPSNLSSASGLRNVTATLKQIVKRHDYVIVSGSLPDATCDKSVFSLWNACRANGAKLILDSSGPIYARMVEAGGLYLIKPNVEELRELLGEKISDTPKALVQAGRALLGQAEMILISRGARGAILVTKSGCRQAQSNSRRRVDTTVGCGDYLLAGFGQGLGQGRNPRTALQWGVQAGTARAYRFESSLTWAQVRRRIRVQIQSVSN
jgi:1-phosphofructokinase family hexose kinase